MLPRRSRISSAARIIPLLVAVCLTGVTVGAQQAEGPGDPKAGRDLFVSKSCIRCHSIWESAGKRGPNLASVGQGRNLYELCASVWSHWSKMNAVLVRDNEARPSLTPTDFKDIIAYLYYLNYNSEPGKAENGQKVFSDKKCIQCHALDPLQVKDKRVRAVYEMQDFSSTVTLAVAVWNHGTNMIQRMADLNIRWPEFTGREVADLVEFIRYRAGVSVASEMVVPGDPGKGRALFGSKGCANCHQPGSAKSNLGTDLASSGPAGSVNSLVARLWAHYPRMSQSIAISGIAYPKISIEEMEHLISYVFWVKASGLAGNPENGQVLYRSKECASCHSKSDGHDATAPSLRSSTATTSPYALLSAIWNHGPAMEARLSASKISWPTLNGEEMRDLVAYLRGSSPIP
jgi:mono/diheme cytochrome c family protein